MAEAKTISVLDIEFKCSMPYDPGHVINEAEAKVLNQTRRENLGNNFREKVRKHLEGGADAPTLDELTTEFAALDAGYAFTMSNASASVKLSPEEREARSIAKSYLKQELDKVGRKITDVPEGNTKEAWEDAIEAEVQRLSETAEIQKMAKDIVKARSKTANLSLTLGNLGTAPDMGGEVGDQQNPTPAA